MDNRHFLEEAYKLALKAYKKGHIPVGAVLVKNNKIIAKGYNRTEKSHIRHAEIIAFEKAHKILKEKILCDCVLYVTLEPCPMCFYAAVLLRIKKIVYGAVNLRSGACGGKIDLTKVSFTSFKTPATTVIANFILSELFSIFFLRIASSSSSVRAAIIAILPILCSFKLIVSILRTNYTKNLLLVNRM